MWPMLLPGDKLIVSFERDNIEAGDIVVAKLSDEFVSHRVIHLKDRKFLKGDHSPHLENYTSENIWGKVVGLQRQHRRYFWGEEGPPAKKFLAWLSSQNQINSKSRIQRCRRWISVLIMIAWHQTLGRCLIETRTR